MQKFSGITRLVLCFTCFSGISVVQAQFQPIFQNFESYNQKIRNEAVYMHLDREVYAPGDTVWFKAYLRNEASLEKSSLSRNFFVCLVDTMGIITHEWKFLVFDAAARGQLAIAPQTAEGPYHILAYSSWMKNYDPAAVYAKPIFIYHAFKSGSNDTQTPEKARPENNHPPGKSASVDTQVPEKARPEGTQTAEKEAPEESHDRGSALHDCIRTSGKPDPEHIRTSGKPDPEHIRTSGKPDPEHIRTSGKPVAQDIRIHFYPEGGTSIQNQNVRMAFRACDQEGRPVPVKGVIRDEHGNQVITIRSVHNGMGVFKYKPVPGTRQFLSLTEPVGEDQLYPLPPGNKTGWQMTVKSGKDRIMVGIRNHTGGKDTCLILMRIRGYNLRARLAEVDRAVPVLFSTGDFPVGAATITLLDKNLVPQAERLVFMNYHKRHSLYLETGDTNYRPREKVTLTIKVRNQDLFPAKGQYSLSVVDERRAYPDRFSGHGIMAGYYLPDEIRSRSVDPDYYFRTGSKEEQHHLDLLLMTQGRRSYAYNGEMEDLNAIPDPVNQDVISGSIVKSRAILNPKPVKGKIKVHYSGNIYNVPTDKDGYFSFLPTWWKGYDPNMTLVAFDHRLDEDVRIRLDRDPFHRELLGSLGRITRRLNRSLPETVDIPEESPANFSLQFTDHVWMDAVQVKTRKQKEPREEEPDILRSISSKKKAGSHLLQESSNVLSVLRAMGTRVDYQFDNDVVYYTHQGEPHPVTWTVNGMAGDTSYTAEAATLTPAFIKELYIITGLEARAYFNAPVVCYIHTTFSRARHGESARTPTNRKALPRYTLPNEFYKPLYDTEEKKQSKIPDLRNTIHWEPDIQFNSKGEARVSFYIADRYTRIRCVVQGISEDGIPVSGQTGYRVIVTK